MTIQSMAVTRSKCPFRLLELPQEIQDTIYSIYLRSLRMPLCLGDERPLLPGLEIERTCRKVYKDFRAVRKVKGPTTLSYDPGEVKDYCFEPEFKVPLHPLCNPYLIDTLVLDRRSHYALGWDWKAILSVYPNICTVRKIPRVLPGGYPAQKSGRQMDFPLDVGLMELEQLNNNSRCALGKLGMILASKHPKTYSVTSTMTLDVGGRVINHGPQEPVQKLVIATTFRDGTAHTERTFWSPQGLPVVFDFEKAWEDWAARNKKERKAQTDR